MSEQPKAHPIIFSGPMVRAILEGRKTQTRRICRPPWGRFVYTKGAHGIERHRESIVKTGGLLWVREAWIPDPPIDGSWPGDIAWNGCGRRPSGVPDKFRKPAHCIYKASWDGIMLGWESPLFMPRWASRITLRVTGVRIQRLQEISEDDVLAEGDKFSHDHFLTEAERIGSFSALWDGINGKRAPWASDPWVVAYTFERVTQ